MTTQKFSVVEPSQHGFWNRTLDQILSNGITQECNLIHSTLTLPSLAIASVLLWATIPYTNGAIDERKESNFLNRGRFDTNK